MKTFTFFYDRYDTATTSIELEKNGIEHYVMIHSDEDYKKFTDGGTIKGIPIITNNPTKWMEPEWGFPKGRRNPHETDITCASREFQEETGLYRQDFTIIQNTYPISETFFGSNQVHY